jgi:hypothetical protein
MRPTLRRGQLLVAIASTAAALAAGPALAAIDFVCHPDPSGTRSLSLAAEVKSYAVKGRTVTIALERGASCAHLVRWHALASRASVERIPGCAHSVAAAPGVGHATTDGRVAAIASDGTVTVTRNREILGSFSPPFRSANELVGLTSQTLVVLTPSPAVDAPAVLHVYSLQSARPIAQWPVPYEPSTLDVDHGTAVFADGRHGGLYAIRLRDGRIGFVGPTRIGDMPQIERAGVVYEDDMYKRVARSGRTLLKYVPAAAVAATIRAAGRPVSLPGRLQAFSMDGPRVATAYYNSANGCDRIAFWNVPWNYLAPVTRPPDQDELDEYPTCAQAAGAQGPHVTGLAIAGIQAGWILSGAARPLITSTSATCVEHIVKRDLHLVSGDRALLAYATRQGQIGVIVPGRKPRALALPGGAGDVSALSVDDGRIAVLHGQGVVDVRTANGDLVASFTTNRPRAIALRADKVIVLTESETLQVFDARTGVLGATWPVPHGLRGVVDAYYGIAVLSRNRQIFAVNLKSGKTALVATAPRAARVQIEAPGIAYGYNVSGHGELRFVSLSTVEQLTD